MGWPRRKSHSADERRSAVLCPALAGRDRPRGGPQHPEGRIFVAGALDLSGGGVEKEQSHHSGIKPFLTAGILVATGGQERLKVQLGRQLQQKDHEVIFGQPVDRRRQQQQGLFGYPETEGFGFAHAAFPKPDQSQSLGSGWILGRLCRGWVLNDAQQAPRLVDPSDC